MFAGQEALTQENQPAGVRRDPAGRKSASSGAAGLMAMRRASAPVWGGGRPPLYPLPGQGAPQRFVVVEDLQRAEAELADVHRVQGVDPAALSTSQVFRERHDSDPPAAQA